MTSSGTAADGDDEGAMPNWVPTFNMKFPGAGAPNWMTAYPTVIYRLWQFTGDAALVRKHWRVKHHAQSNLSNQLLECTSDGCRLLAAGCWLLAPLPLMRFGRMQHSISVLSSIVLL